MYACMCVHKCYRIPRRSKRTCLNAGKTVDVPSVGSHDTDQLLKLTCGICILLAHFTQYAAKKSHGRQRP